MHLQGGFPMIEPSENMKEVYYTPSNQNLSAEEMIDDFIAECEKEAAKLEITVDYYLAEFVNAIINYLVNSYHLWYYIRSIPTKSL